ncbi:MAG: SDR family oxidoreductase [Verrucomicrobiota bacterium]
MNDQPRTKPGTALITGASSGLGEFYARHLAARGYNLILVARRETLLQTVAGDLRQKHGVTAEVLAADLATEPGIALVVKRIQDCQDLTLLINNAGFGSGGVFHQIDITKQLNMIQVHVVATARLTRAALPQMVERRQGGIINVASVAGFACIPTSAMYGSTKAWMIAFSRTIAEELRPTGVRVQALCPGFTHTGFHDTPEYKNFDRSVIPGMLWMTSDEVVAISLKALTRDQVVVIPGLINKIMVAALRLPPIAMLARYYGRKRWHRDRK